MKKTVLILLLVMISGHAISLEHNNAVPNPDYNDSPGTATCGDGVCETIEQGVCPEDCSSTDIPEEKDNSTGQDRNSTQQVQNENEQKSSGGPSPMIIIAGGLTVLLLGTMIYLSMVPE